jgi:hypothetical protein
VNDTPRAGRPPVEPGATDEDGAPIAQTDVPADRQPADARDEADIVTESDGAGMAGGTSGGSGGGSGMPGHPDAAR